MVSLHFHELRQMIRLTRSRLPADRDWATFYLSQVNNDSPLIRKALVEVAQEVHTDAAAEARLALAKRKDPRALGLVRKALSQRSIGILDIRAAGELAHGSLIHLLRRHADSDFEPDLINQAIVACRTRNRAGEEFD